jgi:hypothetical protein
MLDRPQSGDLGNQNLFEFRHRSVLPNRRNRFRYLPRKSLCQLRAHKRPPKGTSRCGKMWQVAVKANRNRVSRTLLSLLPPTPALLARSIPSRRSLPSLATRRGKTQQLAQARIVFRKRVHPHEPPYQRASLQKQRKSPRPESRPHLHPSLQPLHSRPLSRLPFSTHPSLVRAARANSSTSHLGSPLPRVSRATKSTTPLTGNPSTLHFANRPSNLNSNPYTLRPSYPSELILLLRTIIKSSSPFVLWSAVRRDRRLRTDRVALQALPFQAR